MPRIPYTTAGRQVPAQAALQLFRVSADWPGGGWAFNLPFPDAEAARAWALAKVKGREDALITALPRGPAPVLPAPFREDDFLPTALVAGDVDLELARCGGAL